MTGHIVCISGGLSYDSIDYNSLFAIGLMLFIITLGLNHQSTHREAFSERTNETIRKCSSDPIL
jgi:ABC-type phosphate transport system permease subunit